MRNFSRPIHGIKCVEMVSDGLNCLARLHAFKPSQPTRRGRAHPSPRSSLLAPAPRRTNATIYEPPPGNRRQLSGFDVRAKPTSGHRFAAAGVKLVSVPARPRRGAWLRVGDSGRHDRHLLRRRRERLSRRQRRLVRRCGPVVKRGQCIARIPRNGRGKRCSIISG